MFNKPALFPKAADPQPPRGPRTGPGVLGSGPASGMSAGSGDTGGFSRPATGTDAGAVPSGNASMTSASPKDGVEAPVEGGSRLIVGPDVKLKGAEILDCDTLVVEGRVEATMDSRVIRIAENGAFSGKVGVDVAEVFGRFDGELTARSQLIVHASGRVSGKIRYGKIFIEEGGEISGDVQPLSAASSPAKFGERPSEQREESAVTKVAAAG